MRKKPLLAERQLVNIELVIPAPWNARIGHDIQGIKDSIRRFGFRDPIEVIWKIDGDTQDTPMMIVAGAGRWMAARELGIVEIPAEMQTWDSMASARAYGIANNRLTDASQFDSGILLDTLEELDDLTGTGFDLDDLESLRIEGGDPTAPDEFAAYDDDIPTEHECPKCGYQWAGGST